MDEENIKIRLGQRIKELRLERELTQLDIAYTCDFEKTSISRIEAGRTNPTITTLLKISKALDIELKELFEF